MLVFIIFLLVLLKHCCLDFFGKAKNVLHYRKFATSFKTMIKAKRYTVYSNLINNIC